MVLLQTDDTIGMGKQKEYVSGEVSGHSIENSEKLFKRLVVLNLSCFQTMKEIRVLYKCNQVVTI